MGKSTHHHHLNPRPSPQTVRPQGSRMKFLLASPEKAERHDYDFGMDIPLLDRDFDSFDLSEVFDHGAHGASSGAEAQR